MLQGPVRPKRRRAKMVRKDIAKKLYPQRISPVDKLRAVLYKLKPALRPNILRRRGQTIVLENQAAFVDELRSQMLRKLQQHEKSGQKRPLLFTIGSVEFNTAKAIASSEGFRDCALLMATDSYTKVNDPKAYLGFPNPPKYRASVNSLPGQVYNPRAIDVKALKRDLRSLLARKKTSIRVGGPRRFTFKLKDVFPEKAHRRIQGGLKCIILVGIQANALPFAKMSNLRAQVYTPPGLREHKTVERNLMEWPDTERNAGVRLRAMARQSPGARYRQAFFDAGIKSADLLLIQDLSRVDVEAMSPEARQKFGRISGSILEAIESKQKFL